MSDLDKAPPSQRQERLIGALQSRGAMQVGELADYLRVKPVTVRRDLTVLEEAGRLRRFHGGAILRRGAPTAAPSHNSTATGGSATGGTIAMVVPSFDHYWPDIVRGAERAAESSGFRLLLRGSSYELDDEWPIYERLLDTPDLVGILAAPNAETTHTGEVLERLGSLPIPSVLVERDGLVRRHREAVESVTSDHTLGAGMAIHHLADLGHARIGLIASSHSPTTGKVTVGWRQACEELGLDVSDALYRLIPHAQEPDFLTAIDDILDEITRTGTTAVLAHSDSAAVMLVQHAEDHGLAVPGQLSVVAYDDTVAGLYSPAVTAVRPPRQDVGEAAVFLLAARIADPGRAIRRILVSPSLHIRESTGLAPR